MIEFAQGPKGFLLTHESQSRITCIAVRSDIRLNSVYFYVLDALPLFVATAVYFPFWPGQYISPVPEEELYALQSLASPQGTPIQNTHHTPVEGP